MLFADVFLSSSKRTCILHLPFGVLSSSLPHSGFSLPSYRRCSHSARIFSGIRLQNRVAPRASQPQVSVIADSLPAFLVVHVAISRPRAEKWCSNGKTTCRISDEPKDPAAYDQVVSMIQPPIGDTSKTPHAHKIQESAGPGRAIFPSLPGRSVPDSHLSVECAHPTLPPVF